MSNERISFKKFESYFSGSNASSQTSIACDNSGFVYWAYNSTTLSSGTYSTFVRKQNSDGTILWTVRLPVNCPNTSHTSIAYNSNDDTIVVAAVVSGAVSGGTYIGSNDIAVFKMNCSTGSVVWACQTPEMNTNRGESLPNLDLDSTGSVYLAFQTLGTVSGGSKLGTTSTSDIAVCKINTNGTFMWIKQFTQMNSTLNETNPFMRVASDGSLYLAYNSAGSVSSSLLSNTIVITKLDSTGSIVWVKQNIAALSAGCSMALDSNNNLIIASTSSSTVSGGTRIGSTDIVVLKLDSNGNVIWIKQSAAMNTTAAETVPQLETDSLDNIYLVYDTAGTVNGDVIGSSGDLVIHKMNSMGDYIWLRQEPMGATWLSNSTSLTNPKISVSENGKYIYISVFDGNFSMVGIVLYTQTPPSISVSWLKQHPVMNGPAAEANPVCALDTSGNVYYAYYSATTISGGTRAGLTDIVVAKVDTNGNLVWIKQILAMNSLTNDYHPSITIDGSSNVYVSYTVSAAVSGGTMRGVTDIAVAKLDTNGNLLWVKQHASMNTTSSETISRIVADSSGNIYGIYTTLGTVSGGTNRSSGDIVIFSMNTNGDVSWLRQIAALNTINGENPGDIAIDNNGNFYIVYNTPGTVSGAAISNVNNIVVAKGNCSTGNITWIRSTISMNSVSASPLSDDIFPRIAVSSNGNIYISYTTNGTVSGGTNIGNYDSVYAKMDTNGNLIWIKQASSFNTTANEQIDIYSGGPVLKLDSDENVYGLVITAGSISGGILYGTYDVMINCLDKDGNLIWNYQYPPIASAGSQSQGYMTVDAAGVMYLCYTTDTAVSGGALIGSTDIAIAKLLKLSAPSAPTSVLATAGNTQATVSWTAPANDGGASIESYTVTSSPGNRTATTDGSTTSATVTGLDNGTAYTFTVVATNANGNSSASSSSNSVTPSAPSTVPGAPTSVSATAGNAQATVSWTAPASNGGASIESYTVTSSPGNRTATTTDGSTTSATVTGLENGTAYTFTVVATNTNGNSSASSASASVTPSTVPGAPTSVSATAGNAQATVSWTAPASNGGASIESYTVTSSPGNRTATTNNGSTTSATVTGLNNGTAYTFTVVATNANGNSSASSASASVTPSTVPGAPTSVSATAGNAQATVSWTAPASNGGASIESYTVTSSPGNRTATTNNGSTTSATVTGLNNGTAYTFTVVATNANGNSSASSASASVTPSTVPGAPTSVSATAGNAQATVSWTAPASNGGASIESYTVTSSPGNRTATTNNGSTTSATVTGLNNGTAYTFTVVATNTNGNSSASSASASVTPSAPSGLITVPGAPRLVTVINGNLSAIVSWSAPISNGGASIESYTVASNTGGFSEITQDGSTTTVTITGLTRGTSYTFTVTATNSAGTSSPSQASQAIVAAITPNAPTNVTAVAWDRFATVSWSAPTDLGGMPLRHYIIHASSGDLQLTSRNTTIEFTGLTNGTAYTFTVTAVTNAGQGTTSSSSNSVTPNPSTADTAVANRVSTPGTINSFVSTQTAKSVEEVYLDLKSAFANQKINGTLATTTAEATVKNEFISSLRSKANASTGQNAVITLPTTETPTLLDNMTGGKIDTILNIPTQVVLPAFTGTNAVINLADTSIVTDGSKYLHIELPVNYTMTLTDGAASVTLLYNGSALVDTTANIRYVIGDEVPVGSTYYNIVALGSVTARPLENGLSFGDPYITTLNRVVYKLPTMDGHIRYYQGMVNGKLLTINADLKTIRSEDLLAENITSYQRLNKQIPKSAKAELANILLEGNELLTFFERVYVNYDDSTLVLNIWNGRFGLEKQTGEFNIKLRSTEGLDSRSPYQRGYNGTALEIEITKGVNLVAAVYPTSLIRNGLLLSGVPKCGNGVICNILGKSDMRLPALDDSSPVVRIDRELKSVNETFVDHDGYRVRKVNIVRK